MPPTEHAVSGTTPDAGSLEAASTKLEGLLSGLEPDTSKPREKTPAKPAPATKPDPDEELEPEIDEDTEELDDDTKKLDESDEVEDEDTDEEDDKPAPRKIKVDDNTEVDEPELVKGYLRLRDYTQKTQAVAAEKKKFLDEEQPAMREERKALQEGLGKIKETLARIMPAEPDWAKLRGELPPEEFTAQWAEWQQYQKNVDALTAQEKAVAIKATEDAKVELRKILEGEKEKLLEAVPVWKDTARMKKEVKELAEYAQDAGYAPDDLAVVTDHRVLVFLRKAMLYDRSVAKRAVARTKIAEVTDVLAPTKNGPRKPPSKGAAALERLAKSGSVEDAAAAIASRLG